VLAGVALAAVGRGDGDVGGPRRGRRRRGAAHAVVGGGPRHDPTLDHAAPTTTLAVGDTLPPGPAERPTGLIGGVFWDALTGAGVDPGVARCAADALLATTSEADLMSMGIAESPRPAEVDDLLQQAGLACGVTQDQLDAAAG
jgi:hypothetical protein